MFAGLAGFLVLAQFAATPIDASSLGKRLLLDAGFVAVLLTLTDVLNRTSVRWSWQTIGIAISLGVSACWYAVSRNVLAAWLLVILSYAALAELDRAICRHGIGQWMARLGLAVVGGFAPVILNQIESRFADEEFFVFLQGAGLSIFCFLFLIGQSFLHRGRAVGAALRPERGWLIVTVVAVLVGVSVWGVVVYQHSFYTASAPGYPGVSEDAPFLCGQVAPARPDLGSEEAYRQLLARVEANPYKAAPEWGLLALGSGELRWAEAFRTALLAEARSGRFTQPANSVKSTQYEAAQRVYYAPRVRAAFPGLFSDAEWEILRAWFAAINRRALTVEWVDWMYGLALGSWPQGPYENQENGAGLLAILEVEQLGAPELALVNRAYLERNRRGWIQRFRNTDDAYLYQLEWITNAYLQSLYWRGASNADVEVAHRRLAFEWTLLQALPDGSPLGYNHPARLMPTGVAYLAATLERDPRFMAWVTQSLGWTGENSNVLYAQPGIESALSLEGGVLDAGSCLMYGDSGLPNQRGPLAPDKVVFRDGWTPTAAFGLLNLRFSGWHRYKATNSLVLLYQAGPLVVEDSRGKPFDWLPTGRSLFRDKRIPRENLNGLLVQRQGLPLVVHALIGFGSDWAQDPPYYARVESVQWLGAADVSRTVIENWQGWRHTRTIYFVHQGPMIVMDAAKGKGQAAVTWHLVGQGRRDGERLWLRDDPAPASMILPSGDWQNTRIQPSNQGGQASGIGKPDWDVMYSSPAPGQLELATVFALDAWADAHLESLDLPHAQWLKLTGRAGELNLLYNDSGQWRQAPGLATDGRWAMTVQRQTGQVCFEGGTQIEVSWPHRPASLIDSTGRAWQNWEWGDGTLTLFPETLDAAVCLDVMG